MTKPAYPSPGAKRKAKLIVDFVCRWVAKAGHLEGRGENKQVVFEDLLNVRTGTVRPVVREIERQVGLLIDK
jgi:hypothetical protein